MYSSHAFASCRVNRPRTVKVSKSTTTTGTTGEMAKICLAVVLDWPRWKLTGKFGPGPLASDFFFSTDVEMQ